MTITLTRENVAERLAAAVEKNGADYIYPATPEEFLYDDETETYKPSCEYVRDGAPSCLVGHVLADLGLPLDTLRKYDETPGGTGAYTLIRDLLAEGAIEIEGFDGRDYGLARQPVVNLLTDAQSHQDGGKPWGEAVALAQAGVAA